MLVAPVSDVSALVQDMLTSVAGAVVPLTQLPSDLYSFLLGIAGVQPVVGGVEGIDGRWAVGSRGCVGGVAIAAGPATCRYLGALPLAGVSGLPVAGNAQPGLQRSM